MLKKDIIFLILSISVAPSFRTFCFGACLFEAPSPEKPGLL